MRGFRLSEWQRIGIVISVVWAIGATLWTTHDILTMNVPAISFGSVEADIRRAVPWVALAPIPLAWLLVWGLVALVRWIRRGFQPSA
jgi:hypothetical protein